MPEQAQPTHTPYTPPEPISTQDTLARLEQTDDKGERTQIMLEYLQALDDDSKLRYVVNLTNPHSIFNMASKAFDYMKIQNIDWFAIKQAGFGRWSHGGTVATAR